MVAVLPMVEVLLMRHPLLGTWASHCRLPPASRAGGRRARRPKRVLAPCCRGREWLRCRPPRSCWKSTVTQMGVPDLVVTAVCPCRYCPYARRARGQGPARCSDCLDVARLCATMPSWLRLSGMTAALIGREVRFQAQAPCGWPAVVEFLDTIGLVEQRRAPRGRRRQTARSRRARFHLPEAWSGR